ncbi:putative UV excision repair protein RAD23-like protein B [Hypsibius exemplaris]|uniref:UV excision repair protein RAD23 n=1 Tax=Hypsibius exemplaris TaxID=2072580 RepID=A0A1W0X607_HYPEX|nr:putative UV excision repair protein RAD23-like protein B [Hypsibius exemplaris]
MKVTCRLLSQETFTVEAEPANTVLELKEKIQEKKGVAFKADLLKLIYAGKVWENNAATLGELNVSENGRICCGFDLEFFQVNKPKTVTQKPDESSSSSTSAVSAPAPVVNAGGAPVVEQPARPQAPVPQVRPEEAFGLTPAQYEAMVTEILGMGYPRADVERALRAAFFNPDRAVDYLLSGLPPASVEPLVVPGGGAAGNDDPLADFRNSPQLQQLRALIQQDPQMLAGMLQQISQSNPALFQVIRENPEEFLALVQAPAVEPGQAAAAPRPAGAAAPAGAPPGGPGVSYVRVTPEEREAIERLKSLGFPEQMVVEAYLVCDKNEQHAANFLFSQMDEFEQAGGNRGAQ